VSPPRAHSEKEILSARSLGDFLCLLAIRMRLTSSAYSESSYTHRIGPQSCPPRKTLIAPSELWQMVVAVICCAAQCRLVVNYPLQNAHDLAQ
jgi:hypothetical protein